MGGKGGDIKGSSLAFAVGEQRVGLRLSSPEGLIRKFLCFKKGKQVEWVLGQLTMELVCDPTAPL